MTVQSGEDSGAKKGHEASDRRERILDAALSLFAEHGVEGTTMKMLARKANISAGLTYHYFESKVDLLDQVIKSRVSSFPDLDSRHHESVDSVLPEFSLQMGKNLREGIDIIWLFFREYRSSKTVSNQIGLRREECVDSLASYLRARQSAGEVRGIDCRVASRGLLGSLFHIHLLEEPPKEFVLELVEIFLAGIKS